MIRGGDEADQCQHLDQSQADEHDGLDLAGHLRLTSGGFHGLAEEDAQTNARAKSTDTVTDDGQVAGDSARVMISIVFPF